MSPGIIIEGEMQAMMNAAQKQIMKGNPYNAFIIMAIVTASIYEGKIEKSTTRTPLPLKVTWSPPLIRRMQRATFLTHWDHTEGNCSTAEPRKFLEIHPKKIISSKGGSWKLDIKGFSLIAGRKPHLGTFIPNIKPVKSPPKKEAPTIMENAESSSTKSIPNLSISFNR